jgi:hypothetical protein
MGTDEARDSAVGLLTDLQYLTQILDDFFSHVKVPKHKKGTILL